jgi:hypothetical protein
VQDRPNPFFPAGNLTTVSKPVSFFRPINHKCQDYVRQCKKGTGDPSATVIHPVPGRNLPPEHGCSLPTKKKHHAVISFSHKFLRKRLAQQQVGAVPFGIIPGSAV